MDLDLRHHTLDSAAVLVITGDLDILTAPALEGELTAVTAHPGHLVVLDLAGVAFMDCTGLESLIGALGRSRAVAGQLLLAGLRPAVGTVMTITGAHRLFDCHPDAAAAAAVGATASM